MPAPLKPMLGDLELQQVQEIETDGEQVRTRHEVPALEGDFLQGLGRRGTRIDVSGVLSGAESGEGLGALREKFHAAEPVSFVSDIASATKVEDVVIEDLAVRELAGKPERFGYALSLREYTEPPAVTEEDPPEVPPPPPPPPGDEGTLIVEVIVEGDPSFDMSRVRVTLRDAGEVAPAGRQLTNRTDNRWTEENLPAGSYAADAVTEEPQMTGSEPAEVRAGETTEVTITLRPGTGAVAKAFIVHFRFDKAFVEPCMRRVLRQVADYAGEHTDEKLVVVGHTDLAGTPDYNQSLSERRGRSAFAFLTFGRDRAAALAEWNLLRQSRPGGQLPSVKDNWGTREYQYMLEDLGFYTGNVDGNRGPLTDEAVNNFRTSRGLPPGTLVDGPTWSALIEAYMDQDPLAVPESQLLRNASNGCDGGALKWLGCGEKDPVRNTQDAWRPNRRTELLFVTDDAMPCEVPKPDTFDLPSPGVVGSAWCLGPGNPNDRCCFLTRDAAEEGKWLVQPAEPGTFIVRGSIKFEDGTPFANARYVLIAPDGEFMDGEVPRTGAVRAGTPIVGRARADGTFEYPDKPKGVGVYTFELQESHAARLDGEPLEEAKGNVVCKRLDGSSNFDVIVVDRALLGFVPSITLASPIVVVRKTYTNPRRQSVTLSVNTAFTGTGTFTRDPENRIRFFTALVGGTEITNTSNNVFTAAQLTAPGVTIFAEGALPSAALDDVELRLALTVNGQPGLSDTATMTSVLLTLDIAQRRTAPNVTPPALSQADKVNPGRFLQAQDLGNQAERAILIVRPPQPAIPTRNLALQPLSNLVRGFDDEAPGPPDTLLANLHVFSANVPAGGQQLFAEGVTASGAARDTGFQLGIDGLEADGDRVVATVFALELITQANAVVPTTGDDACFMVSKFVTSVNFPDTATFAGPSGANPDPDTFRVQLRGLAGGQAPRARLEVFRAAARQYNHTFDMVEGAVGGRPVYRTDEHVRPVSNAVDDAHRAHQTPLVRLEDRVRATPVLGGSDLGRLELPVGRPPAENGPKAIRTADVHFVTIRGVPSVPATIIERMNEDWAQVAIRYNLLSRPPTVDTVRNVLTIEGAANAAGQIDVDVTPQGGATAQVTVALANGDTAEQIAQNLAAGISAQPGLAASHHRHRVTVLDGFIVLVNRGTNVDFNNINSTVATVDVQEPALDFTNGIDFLEGSVLGLNFRHADLAVLTIIAVGLMSIEGSRGRTGMDSLAATLPGWQNLSIMRQEAVDAADAGLPFTAGHEVGHAVLDGGHHPDAVNLLMGAGTSTVDTIGASKRLDDPQNTRARLRSGPNTVPPILKRR